MKRSVIIKDKRAILSVMIIFVFMSGLVQACSSVPKKVWYKSGSTQAEIKIDKRRCEVQAQQGDSSAERMHATGTFCLDPYCRDNETQNIVVENWKVFKACMEEHGWSLVEKKKE